MLPVILRLPLFLVLALLLGGCPKNYSFPEAIYQGVKTQDTLNSTPIERSQNADLNYQQYEAERKRPQ
jgi:hypothetical protein